MNETATNGSSCPSPDNHIAENIGKTLAYCFILAVSLIGNCFVAIIVYKTKTMRKPINYFIANMAISDLLYPIFLFPTILTKFHVASWLTNDLLGQVLCKFVHCLPSVCLGVSVASLVLISVDRFGAVVFPLRSPLISSRLCFFVILATWIIATASFSPFWFAYKVVKSSEKLACVLQWNEAFGKSSNVEHYVLAIYVVVFYIPIVLITMLYTIIIYKLKTQKIPGEQSGNAEQQRAKRNRNVLNMSFAIVFVFVLSWVPFSIITLLTNRGWPCNMDLYEIIGIMMTSANSAINPWICFIFSKNYRDGLHRLFNHAKKTVTRNSQKKSATPPKYTANPH